MECFYIQEKNQQINHIWFIDQSNKPVDVEHLQSLDNGNVLAFSRNGYLIYSSDFSSIVQDTKPLTFGQLGTGQVPKSTLKLANNYILVNLEKGVMILSPDGKTVIMNKRVNVYSRTEFTSGNFSILLDDGSILDQVDSDKGTFAIKRLTTDKDIEKSEGGRVV